MSLNSSWSGPIGSHLAAHPNGWDFVVSVTEYSVNEAVKRYLLTAPEEEVPAVKVIFVKESWVDVDTHDTTPIDYVLTYDEWVDKMHDLGVDDPIDPFSLDAHLQSNGIPDSLSPELKRIFSLYLGIDENLGYHFFEFIGGLYAKLGIPGKAQAERNGTLDELMARQPDILRFDSITDVKFRLLCEDMIILEKILPPPPPNPEFPPFPTMLKGYGQDPADPWVFNVGVNLNFDAVNFESLSLAIQEQMQAVSGEMFSIKQLLFDVTQPSLAGLPELPKISDAKFKDRVSDAFVEYYWKLFLLGNGGKGPALGYAGQANVDAEYEGSLLPLDFRLGATAYRDPASGNLATDEEGRKFNTLNYMCMSRENRPLPSSEYMEWNPVARSNDPAQGVVSTHRDHIKMWITSSNLANMIRKRCYTPYYTLGMKTDLSVEPPVAEFWDVFELGDLQDPQPVVPANESSIGYTAYTHRSSREFQIAGPRKILTEYNYNVGVQAVPGTKTIEIKQHIQLRIRYTDKEFLQPTKTIWATHLNRTITDKLDIEVKENGDLYAVHQDDAEIEYHSEQDFSNFGGWYESTAETALEVNRIIGIMLENKAWDLNLSGLISKVGAFVLPAGETTFKYDRAEFSDYGDLRVLMKYQE